MKNNKTIKTLTLVSFVILLTSFIAFKSGTFDKYLKGENDKSISVNSVAYKTEGAPVDTPPIKTFDTVRVNPTMLSTSKSMIVYDQKMEFPKKDSLKKDSTKSAPKK